MKKKKRKEKRSSRPKGLRPGLRMKGGVRYDPAAKGFFAIVHIWDNPNARGEPDEWRDPQVFSNEEAAMRHYKSSIRPSLEKMMAKARREDPSVTALYRKLEE